MTDALVVGGGLAGAALATRLARAGRKVVLLEREAGPHDKVCGEFLSHEATLYLESLGLDLIALGAQPIDRLRLSAGGRAAAIRLPFPALSLSRRVVDDALLGLAAASGAEIRMGAQVRRMERVGGGWLARLDDGDAVGAGAAFLACGKHDLKGWPRPPGLQNDLIGFKLHMRLAPPQRQALASHVELTLFRGGYAGLQPVEERRANLCLVVRKSRFAALGQQWAALLAQIRSECPLLDQRLAGAEPCRERPMAIAAIPYGYVGRRDDGLWRLGDQMAVIPSFAGDGMSIALHSAALASDYFLRGSGPSSYRRQMARDVGGRVRFAAILSAAAVTKTGRLTVRCGAAAAPGLVSVIASLTRVPAAALRRVGLVAP
jgi:flavin-dependent dehydrogenase